MQPGPSTAAVRRASGLPEVTALRAAARVDRAEALAARLPCSPALHDLVALAARTAGAASAQLSLLGARQTATALRCGDTEPRTATADLQDSLCTITVLSGDVLVVADATTHPWLHDLPPVAGGSVRSYLGVPLRLADGTDVGALCVYGPDAHDWTQAQVIAVCDVADRVALELQRLDAGVSPPDPRGA